nr:hypothetical protein [Tanacetum cinerariifolium]
MVNFILKPKGGIGGGEGGSPSNRSINNEALVIDVNTMNSAPPSYVAENVRDLDDVSLEKGIVDEAKRLCKSLKGIEFLSARELKDSTDYHLLLPMSLDIC